MADWSEIFEKRLSAVLAEGRESHESNRTRLELELTPPPTVDKETQRAVNNPTASFFDSIRRNARANKHKEHGPPGETQPAAYTTSDPTFHNVEGPATKRLQESYSDRAKSLHDDATKQLSETQFAFEKQLLSMEDVENAFLSSVDKLHGMFSKPLHEWVVKIQTRERGGTEIPTEKDERVVDRITQMRTAAATLEGDLEKTWKELDQMHNEVANALRAIFDNCDEGARRDDYISIELPPGIMTRNAGTFGGATYNEIIRDAERDLDAAAADAIREMRDNEKTYRKLILAEECKLAQAMLARQSKYD